MTCSKYECSLVILSGAKNPHVPDDSCPIQSDHLPCVILSGAKNLSSGECGFFAPLRMTMGEVVQVTCIRTLHLHQFHSKDVTRSADLFQCPLRNGIVHRDYHEGDFGRLLFVSYMW